MTKEQMQESSLTLNLTFTKEIPGFPNVNSYNLIESIETKPFYILQPQDGEFSFLLIHSFDYISDYDFFLTDSDKEMLKLTEESKVLVFSIINRRNGLQDATVNLKAPIVVNPSEGLAAQIILECDAYTINEPLIKAIKRSR